jgi:hypothetical protein
MERAVQEAQERRDWEAFWNAIEEAKLTTCGSCPWTLICTSGRYPHDAKFCRGCNNVVIESSRTVVACLAVVAHFQMHLTMVSQRFILCPFCIAGAHNIDAEYIEGIQVETPMVKRLERIKEERNAGG